MALMFQRLARNFAANGYFPTDARTTAGVLNALAAAKQGEMRLLDPCAGEGVALAECKQYLGNARVRAYGVEYDAGRAWHAKDILDQVIHGDVQDCVLGRRQFGLLWLNPPYGDLVTDKAATGDKGVGRQRLEKLFYRLTVGSLQTGGVLVLIVPHYTLDREMAAWITRHFDRVRIFRVPESRFQQVVVLGVRRGTDRDQEVSAQAPVRAMLAGAADSPELPDIWDADPYTVPTAPPGELKWMYARMDARQLAVEARRYPCLWDQFDLWFARGGTVHRRPLRQLSDWHLALALAAGQISGVVRSNDGQRVLVVRGDTIKEKTTKIELEASDEGLMSEVRVLTDKFVPVIRALDMTPGSPTFGEVLVIK